MSDEKQGVSTALQPNWNDVWQGSRAMAERVAGTMRRWGWPKANVEDNTDDDGQYLGSYVVLQRGACELIYFRGHAKSAGVRTIEPGEGSGR